MISIILILSLSLSHSSITPPNCNFASTNNQFFPINACTEEKTVDGNTITYKGTKYQCRGNNQVYRLEYDTAQYCNGPVVSEARVTDELSGFECDKAPCPYAQLCAFTGCSTSQTNCTACEQNPNAPGTGRVCRPAIVDNCFGQNGLFKNDQCTGNVLSEKVIFDESKTDCSSEPIFTNSYGGSDSNVNCQFGTYFQVNCIDSIQVPTCNYVSTDFTYIPIGGCNKERKLKNDLCVEYFAFEYVCDGENLVKNEYNTIDYCNGSPSKTTIVNNEVDSFECDKNTCNFAEVCTQTRCSTTDESGNFICDDCASLRGIARNRGSLNNAKKFDLSCINAITNECVGAFGLFINTTCDDRRRGRGDALTETFYFDKDCTNSLFADTTDDTCDFFGKTTVSCKNDFFVDAKVKNPIIDSIINNPKEYGLNLFGFSLNLFELILIGMNILTFIGCIFVCVICKKCRKTGINSYAKLNPESITTTAETDVTRVIN